MNVLMLRRQLHSRLNVASRRGDQKWRNLTECTPEPHRSLRMVPTLGSLLASILADYMHASGNPTDAPWLM